MTPMSRHTRILLVQENRYQALLNRRELGARLTDTVVAVYTHPADALPEFSHIQYDLAVVDAAIRSLPPGEFVTHLRTIDPTLPLIVLVEPGDPVARRLPADEKTTFLTKEGQYHRLLPDLALELRRTNLPDAPSANLQEQAGLHHDVDALVANLENDINNPLMAILGAAELIDSRTLSLPEDIAQKVDIIRSSAQRIQEVLTAFSRTSRVT